MRILHVLDHSLPLHSGYAFRTRAIMMAQLARGWTVEGVTGRRQGGDRGGVDTVDGLVFHRTPAAGRQWSSPLSQIAEIRALRRRIAGLIDTFAPDLLHVHSPVLGALAALKVARLRNLPLLYEIRAFWEDAAIANGAARPNSLRVRLTRALEDYAVARADAVAVICDGLRNDLIDRGVSPDKISVVPNGVDMSMFGSPAPFDPGLAVRLELDGREVIAFIGSLYDYEGVDDLIAAMPRLLEVRPDAALLIVGSGPRENALRAQARQSPASARIHFTGSVPHKDVPNYYSLADILAYPRRSMRLTELVTPLKPLEAMAQGRLVAATDIGGHRELIENGVTGVFFPPANPSALADRLAALLGDRTAWPAITVAARSFVERDRNWSSNIARYEPLYRALIGRRTGDGGTKW